MRLERKIEIESSLKKVFGILVDGMNASRWNPTVNIVEQIGESRYLLKTSVGDVTITNTEFFELESVTWFMEKSDMNSIGYIVSSKDEIVEVRIFVDFDNPKFKKAFDKAAEFLLQGLKKYVDYLEEGGIPEEFDKGHLVISPM